MQVSITNMAVIAALCAMTALVANIGVAVFNDGVRPFVPEFLEGRMPRREYALAVFGMCVGFIASVGIGNALTTDLMNPWLLFLATDIIGAASPRAWLAALLGGAWGMLCLAGVSWINAALTFLPVDLIGALGQLGTYIVTSFALFPVIAIIMQFGWRRGAVAAPAVLTARVIGPTWTLGPSRASVSADAWTLLTGVVLLIVFVIMHDLGSKDRKIDEVLEDNVFTERVGRIRRSAPLLMIVGALIALACNLHMFAGSAVSMFTLSDAYRSLAAADAPAQIQTAAVNELFRGISFVPLIAMTAITTGVYGIAGFTFIYAAGYVSPNPVAAAASGALIMLAEVLLLGRAGALLGRFPSFRDASDTIRSAIGATVEFAILFGSLNAVIAMGTQVGNPTLGFGIAGMIYFINEVTGRRIMRMAIGPVFALGTGILLNIFCALGCVTLAA